MSVINKRYTSALFLLKNAVKSFKLCLKEYYTVFIFIAAIFIIKTDDERYIWETTVDAFLNTHEIRRIYWVRYFVTYLFVRLYL